ncbi:MAG: sulfite exporter TauE/SafE family protein [Chloroflexota bacterium]|nr:sulfite exporter TauE/SafE family protein [Chloroflexota bacterium]
MTPLEGAAILAAGVGAGAINAVVGSGSLITYPTLLAFGYAPIVANVSNTIGLVPGSISGAVGYRRELAGQGARAVPLGVASILGGLSGGILLLVLPSSAFERVVPLLILAACLLVAVQPWISRAAAARPAGGAGASLGLIGTVFVSAIYGGYFGAAQGVILIGLLGIFISDELQRLTALKNVLQAVVNGVAGLLFILIAPVAWEVAVLIAIGSIIGGQLGARFGRRLSPVVLRGVIIIVGTTVAVRLLIG